jgi:hypothetical protein
LAPTTSKTVALKHSGLRSSNSPAPLVT